MCTLHVTTMGTVFRSIRSRISHITLPPLDSRLASLATVSRRPSVAFPLPFPYRLFPCLSRSLLPIRIPFLTFTRPYLPAGEIDDKRIVL